MVAIEAFDVALLPNRAMTDTGALIRGLGERFDDPRSPVCRGFFEAMMAHRRKILVSTITYGEMLRGRRGAPPAPPVPQIELVSFDQVAAERMQAFPPELIKSVTVGKDEYRLLLQDSMILASAIRVKADVLVTLDGPLHELAKAVGMNVARPEHFLSKQAPLPFEG